METGVDTVKVCAALRSSRSLCPKCDYTRSACYETGPVPPGWRHLALGSFKLVVSVRLPWFECSTPGWRVEGVSSTRLSARFTREFEALAAWPATTAVSMLLRIDWDTVVRICQPVVRDEVGPRRRPDAL